MYLRPQHDEFAFSRDNTVLLVLILEANWSINKLKHKIIICATASIGTYFRVFYFLSNKLSYEF